jgi:Integrase core domain/Thiolase, N-terminal domain
MTRDAVIVSTARTPIGRAYRGAFNATPAPTLASHAVRAAVERAGVDPREIDDVLLGSDDTALMESDHPDNLWMTQIARNVTGLNEGFLNGKRYLLLDRDAKYSDAFRGILVRAGIEVIRLPPRSPNLNAFAERFVRSVKEECLDRMIFVKQAPLRHALTQYLIHYHGERNHQGLGNQLLRPPAAIEIPDGPIIRRQRLGGMLSYYHRAAA